MPVYDMIEYQLVKHRIPNGFVTRLVYRTIYIILVAFVAITLPFFGGEHPPSMHVCAVNVCMVIITSSESCCSVFLYAEHCAMHMSLCCMLTW